MKIIINVCRLLVGAVFIFSGFTKGVDPIGSVYKFTDYFNAFGMSWLNFSAVFCAFALLLFEFLVGVALVFNVFTRFAAWGALIFMSVFTPLSLLLALTNPVSDCGCFGDAVTLTNWQTFWKNIVILVCALFVFVYRRRYKPSLNLLNQCVLIILGGAFILCVSIYGYTYLPIVDFRPYAIGTDIRNNMRVSTDDIADEYKITLYYRNKQTGEVCTFTEDNYPWQDTLGWEYVSIMEHPVKKVERHPMRDFHVEHPIYGDITADILACTDYTFLAVAYNLDKSDTGTQPAVNALAEWAKVNGHKFWGLTASSPGTVTRYQNRENVPYVFCSVDETQLKTMIRSNPGVILLHNGTVIGKWPGNALPDLNTLSLNNLTAFCFWEQQKLQKEYLLSSFIFLFFAIYFVLPKDRRRR